MKESNQFARLRELLSEPSDKNWNELCVLFTEWPVDEELTMGISYAEEHLREWPSSQLRPAPLEAWKERGEMLYRLPMPLAIEFVPMIEERWEVARKRVLEERGEDMGKAPRSCVSLCVEEQSSAMRERAMKLAGYLTHGLELAPREMVLVGGEHKAFVHHGDVKVNGGFDFRRDGYTGRATVITGNVVASGMIYGGAFEGELAVGGNMQCDNLIADAEIGVWGEISCKYARLGWYDCTYEMGALKADVFVEHEMGLGGEIYAKLHIVCEDHSTSLEPEHRELLESLLRPAVVNAIYGETPDDLGAAYERLDEVITECLERGSLFLEEKNT